MGRKFTIVTLAAMMGFAIFLVRVRPEIMGFDTVSRRTRTAARMDRLAAQVRREGNDSISLTELMNATTSSDAFERSHALSTLSTIDNLPEAAVLAIANQLKNEDSQTRNSASLALANMGEAAAPAVQQLVWTLKTYPDDGAGTWAAEALGNTKIKSPTVLQALKFAAHESENTSTVRRARQSYERLTGEPINDLVQ